MMQCERYERQVVELKALVAEMRDDMYATMRDMTSSRGFAAPMGTAYDERMRELGVEI